MQKNASRRSCGQGQGVWLAALIFFSGHTAWGAIHLSSFSTDGWYKHFQASFVGVNSSSLGDLITGEASWNPEISLDDHWFVMGNFGFSLFKVSNSNQIFPMLEYEAFMGYHLGEKLPLFIQVGGGGQTFATASGGTGAEASVNLGYSLNVNVKKMVLDRIVVGVTNFFFPQASIQEYKIGVGILF